jgi:hypothetical protein
MLVLVLIRLVAAGVVDLVDFKMFHNAVSTEVDRFLRDDLKDLRPFLLNMIMFYIVTKLRRWLRSTTPAVK